jgi:NNP family nitrate/nitrite transporter-like MFS transporter
MAMPGETPPLAAPRADAQPARRPGVILVVATVGFVVNCWAWALLSPLGPDLQQSLGLSSFQQALVVALPVLVGALGRIPVGALTDRHGGRIMLPVVSFATVVPTLFLGLGGTRSLAGLLVGGFFLGIGGTVFAAGVPLVSAWYPPQRRGFALGVFGAGMGGTAISALTTVRLIDAYSTRTPFVLTAAVLVGYGLVAWVVVRDAPGRTPPTDPLARRLAATLRLRITQQASGLYAVAFGGYVAFSVYLPTYLKTAYGLTPSDAANRTAGFVLVAVVLRPVGGWLSDRIGAVPVLAGAMAVVTAGAVVAAFTPELIPVGTIAFLAMAGALGAGAGATFALVAERAPAAVVGGVTGLVGAAGGLGGFVPPLLMGSLYAQFADYGLGLALLAAVAALAAVFTLTAVRRPTEVHR